MLFHFTSPRCNNAISGSACDFQHTRSAPLSRWRDKICIIIVPAWILSNIFSVRGSFSLSFSSHGNYWVQWYSELQLARRDKEWMRLRVAATPAAHLVLFQIESCSHTKSLQQESGYLAIKMIEWVAAAAASELLCSLAIILSARLTFIHAIYRARLSVHITQ